jgi:multidrug efflux pump subunit AcrA (membrane-fusion protein)
VALQSDLPRLSSGQTASVAPAQALDQSDASEPSATFSGTLTLAPTADADRRTIDLVLSPSEASSPPAWAKAGVSAFLEVVTQGDERDELAIPLKCVARDGTAAIIFRRDPADPNKANRMEADLGLDDGRWVAIKSGVAEGNEIVLDGVYQLMVATSGSITKGGHFHPDGTFHEGDH